MTKKCTKCKVVKDIDLFYRNKNHLDGRQHACKKCANIMTKKWRFGKGFKAYRNYKKSPEVYKRHLEYNRKNTKKQRDNLDDCYIRKLISTKSLYLKPDDIPDEYIKAHKINLKLKRLLRKG